MLSAAQLQESMAAAAASTSGQALATAAAAVVAGLVVLRWTRRRAGTVEYAKAAGTLPVLGNTLDAAVYQVDRIYDWLTEQSEALGPWALRILGDPPNVIVTSPELIEDITKTQFELFQRGDQDTDCMKEFFGKGILASDGDAWYFHRKTASRMFSHQMMRDVMYTAVRDKSQTLYDVLRQHEARGAPVSFKEVISHFTSDVFGKIGFGIDLHCLENGLSGAEGNEFVEAFRTTMRIVFMRYQQPAWLWHFKRFLNIGDEKQLKESIEVINTFIFRVINESIAWKKSTADKDDDGHEPKDLISLFLNSTIKEEEHIKAKAFDSEMHLIRDTIVNFIFAGKDTTSHSMSFFIVMMNRYPNVLEKIREELRKKVPGLVNGEQAVPSIDDLPQLTYLEAVIRENLRLFPPVPWVSRQAKAATVLCDGTPIPYNTRVGMLVYGTGRSKEVWGDDAREFKPERWIDPATGKLVTVSPYKFAPFIAGPRQCIGIKLAMMELKCALAVLTSKFDFKTVEDPWSITYEAGLTMGVKGPLLVAVSSTLEGAAGA